MIVHKDFPSVLILTVLFVSVSSWRTCEETFCWSIRSGPYKEYIVDWKTVQVIENENREFVLTAELTSDIASFPLTFLLKVATDSVFNVQIYDAISPNTRFKLFGVLSNDLGDHPIHITVSDSIAVMESYHNKVILYGEPFRMEFYSSDLLMSVITGNDIVFETGGSTAPVGLQVSFLGTQSAYGIPLHADRMSLRNTRSSEPYRLFNVDNNYYQVNSTEPLYGAIPVLYAHGTNRSAGMFWHNAADTWVDITTSSDQVDTYFMSESGQIDVYVLMGPTLDQAVKQYTTLTNTGFFPPYFSLGYHQCRNYENEEEVLAVARSFDENSLPLDAIWLDIDYTEDRKFFTWDPVRFSAPVKLQAKLTAMNRKLVALISPFIKIEEGYLVHELAAAKGYYARNPNWSYYIGDSPSGNSSYMDTVARYEFYENLFSLTAFNGKNIHIWHDQNEPAVFKNPNHEDTLDSGVRYGEESYDWYHVDLHNTYGFFQSYSTYRGLLKRRFNSRPFVLTRSHFAAIQNYAAVWTGRTKATWDYLLLTFPMCLSEALAGVSFCGGDVGGFGGIPDEELYQRWYQAGAWLPLYRGHSADDVPRREPYLYSNEVKMRVRAALKQRYAHLPVWYTLFWEHTQFKDPVIRPITYQYPKEAKALAIDTEVLVGSNILAAPVLGPGVSRTLLYLPGGSDEIWYNIDDNYRIMFGTGYQLLRVDLNSVPVFYRGGSIIPRKDKMRRSSGATHDDPYTLYVCLDKNQEATGTLYVDDFESFDYKLLKYLYVGFSFANKTLSSHKIHVHANYKGAAEIGQIIVLSPPTNIVGARVLDSNKEVEMEIKATYGSDGLVLSLNNVHLSLQEPFKLELYS